ncbi:hypothetical protein G3I67_14165 [Orrella sp. NBD-18]|uniref:HTH luxR-type domain-containing protein n=1 Tax=Sheuella amnicola TaxID=2707330 RepID=A0A6B2RAS1_9BURK|nr:LuxR C-terminal-related transcriptional regulator [Sheuella amnicola]NDY84375.1 hypothetical protein [Sheuella amnicola]HBI83871.1 hypothetical protein [Alcaligenaceae bacterium]
MTLSNKIKKASATDLSLTPRQEQILGLLMEGKTNKEIADDLSVQYGTVKQHLFVLFRKLGVTSRSKAVLAANHLMKSSRPDNAFKNKSGKSRENVLNAKKLSYVWRMISVVSVFVPDSTAIKPEVIVSRDKYLYDLREVMNEVTEALDGRFISLPYGGMLAWFGHPSAHLDDADRAVQLAQKLQLWSDQYFHEHAIADPQAPELKPIGLGVASRAEIVADQTTELLAADSFRMAAMLARYARSIGRPLADASTQKLAPLSVPWLNVKVNFPNHLVDQQRLQGICALGQVGMPLLDVRSRWMGMPFLDQIFETVESGVAQWLAVESWPPAATTSLIDAIGNAAAHRKFKMLRLRFPANGRRDRLISSLACQIELVASDLGVDDDKFYSQSTSGERVGAMIADCANQGMLVVQVYGFKALDALASLLGERGIDSLMSHRILFVVANLRESGTAQTTIRLLGPRPTNMPMSRVFSMKVPDLDLLPDQIRVDLQALIDSLSVESRALITLAASHPESAIDECLEELKYKHHQTQMCLNELTMSGLVAPRSGGGFQFRDLTTAQAIHKLSLSLP